MHTSQTENRKYKANRWGKLDKKYVKNENEGKRDKRRSLICVIENIQSSEIKISSKSRNKCLIHHINEVNGGGGKYHLMANIMNKYFKAEERNVEETSLK